MRGPFQFSKLACTRTCQGQPEICFPAGPHLVSVPKVGDVLRRCSAWVLQEGKSGEYAKKGHGARPFEDYNRITFEADGEVSTRNIRTRLAPYLSRASRCVVTSRKQAGQSNVADAFHVDITAQEQLKRFLLLGLKHMCAFPQDFKTVMAAIGSNNERWGIFDVTLELSRS